MQNKAKNRCPGITGNSSLCFPCRRFFSAGATKRMLRLLFITFFLVTAAQAQQPYTIDVTGAGKEIRRGHLDLGGKSVTGESIEVNSFYIERNGKPFFPVMGEFHYARYPNQYWDEEIKKMKAGGIHIVASYVFWILHERQEGIFNWEGDLNLRKFVELCRDNNMEVIIRIGPFAHGEMRNGGLPDWLYGRPFEIRSNDPGYLYYAERLYGQIAAQLRGLYFRDGGPVIGIQIENEYQHSAAPWSLHYPGSEKEWSAARFDRKIIQGGVGVNEMGNDYAAYGRQHMQMLKDMAVKAGMEAPIYTATGWGYASIVDKGSIPVSGGYAYPTWVSSDLPSTLYLYKDLHKEPDYAPVSYDPQLYPSMAAELGTGMCITYSKRPRVPAESFLPMMVRTLGSGTNGLGYYMYHGGNTPSDGHLYYTEGFGYTLKSYDYQAPVGEFGTPGPGFYSLKTVNSFLQYFGDRLAPLPVILPGTNAGIRPENTKILRYAVRSNGRTGFVFMHNFQDHVTTSDLEDLSLKIITGEGEVNIPETGFFTLKSGTAAILPFNMALDDLMIRSATVQPFCSFTCDGEKYHVWISFEGINAEIAFHGALRIRAEGASSEQRSGNTFVRTGSGKAFAFEAATSGKSVHFLVLPLEKARHAYLTGDEGNRHLVISDALVLEDKENTGLIWAGKESCRLDIYPAVKAVHSPEASLLSAKADIPGASAWKVSVPAVVPDLALKRTDDRHFVLEARNLDLTRLNDVFVCYNYTGDRALCFLDGRLLTDHFCIGQPWQIGLKRYALQLKDHDMYFYFIPVRRDAPYLEYFEQDFLPDFSPAQEFLEIKEPEIIPEYRINISIK